MNHQYYNGGTLRGALSSLWEEGGVCRFYKGLGWAIIQNPISRFGDTFANVGVLALFTAMAWDQTVPLWLQTTIVATVGAGWRIFLTPIDLFKTTMQVQGDAAMEVLWKRVSQNGVLELWAGAGAIFIANWMGMYPFWSTLNTLEGFWPAPADPTMNVVR